MTTNDDIILTAVLTTLEEREKVDRLVCLASGAFVPFAAGIVFSESFSAQEAIVRFLYIGHLSLVIATTAAAFLCLRWIHLARALMRLETFQVGYNDQTPDEKATMLLDEAKPYTVPIARVRGFYEVTGAGALALGLASYLTAAIG